MYATWTGHFLVQLYECLPHSNLFQGLAGEKLAFKALVQGLEQDCLGRGDCIGLESVLVSCIPRDLPNTCSSMSLLCLVPADALVPFLYIQQLEAVSSAQSNPTGNVYAGPVLFEQDSTGVPAMVRVTDYMWSGMALQNLNNWTGIGFPISNYRYDG